MPSMDNSQQHWLELAEQLGLPQESAEHPPALSPSARASDYRTIEPKTPPVDVMLAKPIAEPETAPLGVEQITEPAAADERPAVGQPLIHADEERRPPQGRRRGNRGGRRTETRGGQAEPDELGSRDDRPASQEAVADESGEEVSPTRDRSRRRGRGRSRRKKEDVEPASPIAGVDEEAVPTEETIQAADDGSEDDTDDMSGWTIPSWQELIDSLYRPDR
jgi:hypothetical protein